MAKLSAAPSKDILEAALQGLETQKEKIDDQIAQVRAMMGRRVGRPPASGAATRTVERSQNGTGAGRKKRTLTAEARKRIAAAQKKRWAAFRKTQA